MNGLQQQILNRARSKARLIDRAVVCLAEHIGSQTLRPHKLSASERLDRLGKRRKVQRIKRWLNWKPSTSPTLRLSGMDQYSNDTIERGMHRINADARPVASVNDIEIVGDQVAGERWDGLA